MIPEHLLGRYECTIGNHNKFYTILYDEETGTYTHIFGAIGCDIPNERRGNSEGKARAKISNMSNKGYVRVGGQTIIKKDKVSLKKSNKQVTHELGKRKLEL